MEERKYTFYDRYQKVKYANITAEELEVLNIFYNKEHYMFHQQHRRNNTVLFCGFCRSMESAVTGKYRSIPCGFDTTRMESPSLIRSISTSTMFRSTALQVKDRFSN